MLKNYALLMRLDRPIGIFLLLWPTLWALWIAGEGEPDGFIVLIFMLGVFLMRSAGCVINDFADRKVDGGVERTQNRPLVTGAVSSQSALILFAVLGLTAFLLVLQLDWLTIQWSFVALFFAILYPFSKRFTYLPQVFLGLAFSCAIPMAFTALTGEVPVLLVALLVTLNISWIVAYDTIYAIVDREDDLKVGIKSTAILFGKYDRLIIGLLQLWVLVLLLLLGYWQSFNVYYYWVLILSASLLIYQQYLIRHYQREACFTAFLSNNWFGLSVFVALGLNYAMPI